MEIKIQKTTTPKAKTKWKNLGFGHIFTDHMFVMNYTEGKGWHDARIEPYANISLAPSAESNATQGTPWLIASIKTIPKDSV